MPAKNKNRRATQKHGARFEKRTAQQAIARAGRWEPKNFNAVIADSIHSVRLKEKSGTEIFFAYEDDIDKKYWSNVLAGVWDAYTTASFILRGEVIKETVLDFKFEVAMFIALEKLKKLLPQGFDMNIDHDADEENWHVTFFKECEWNYGWNYFEVGPALLKLSKENKRLHLLLLSFLKAMRKAGVEFWCDGMIATDIEMMDDNIENIDFENDIQRLDYQNNIDLYKKGDARKYMSYIKKAPDLSFDEMQKRAYKYKSPSPIANAIYQGCEVFKTGYRIHDFGYYLPNESYLDNSFLELESQISIIWKDDAMINDHRDTLDAIAQEGVQAPIVFQEIKKETKEIDFMKMRDKAAWPFQLYNYFNRADELIKKYVK